MVKNLISILGPTAVGKTAYSVHLARKLQIPIVSADSVQIYRGMDIGTGKITEEEKAGVPHYLLDVREPDEAFSAGNFGEEVQDLLKQLFEKHATVVLCGGSGFYLQAIWEGMDQFPEVDPAVRKQLNAELAEKGLAPLLQELEQGDPVTFARIDQKNPARIIRALEIMRGSGKPISFFQTGQKKEMPWKNVKVGLTMERPNLHERISQRVDGMVAQGLFDEVKTLWERYGESAKALGAVGYKEVVQHFKGEFDAARAIELIKRNSRRLARRQYTWFNRYPDLKWFHYQDYSGMDQWIGEALGNEA